MAKIDQLRERRQGIAKSINRVEDIRKNLPGKFPFRNKALDALALYNKRLHNSQAELSDKIAKLKAAAGTPSWLPPKYAVYWKNPWNVDLANVDNTVKEFKAICWSHGYVSPNFHRSEAGSKDGQPVPGSLQGKCQYHAFGLERVRHKLGDKPIHMLSWYRSPTHNANVGGVADSQHLQAWGTDWSDAERIRLGSTLFNSTMQDQYRLGGRGTYQGNIRHVDNGPARTWVYG